MKIFSMNECDRMIGASLEECKAEYIENYSDADAIDDDACEVTDEALDLLRFRICSDDGQNETTRTFQQQFSVEMADGGYSHDFLQVPKIDAQLVIYVNNVV